MTTREINNYIAEVLHVKEGTIKQHFKNIYDKIGIDDRHDLIELCEHNFTGHNDPASTPGASSISSFVASHE